MNDALTAFGQFMLTIVHGLQSVEFFGMGFSLWGFLVGSFILILCIDALAVILGNSNNLRMEDKK